MYRPYSLGEDKRELYDLPKYFCFIVEATSEISVICDNFFPAL